MGDQKRGLRKDPSDRERIRGKREKIGLSRFMKEKAEPFFALITECKREPFLACETSQPVRPIDRRRRSKKGKTYSRLGKRDEVQGLGHPYSEGKKGTCEE